MLVNYWQKRALDGPIVGGRVLSTCIAIDRVANVLCVCVCVCGLSDWRHAAGGQPALHSQMIDKQHGCTAPRAGHLIPGAVGQQSLR